MKQDRKEAGSRPGWRGPGMTKSPKGLQEPKASKVSGHKDSEVPITTEELLVLTEIQQQMLNVYKHAFPRLAEGNDALKPLLQEVKQALFERDFERAFGRQDYLEAYALRWSPSRAICYLSILVDLRDYLGETALFRSITHSKRLSIDEACAEDVGQSCSGPAIHVACLGGGAAEVVAFGGLLKYLIQSFTPSDQVTESSSVPEANEAMTISGNLPSPNVGVLLLDSASWQDVIYVLSSTLTSPPPLSKYASASAKAANAPFLPAGTLNPTFQLEDLLSMSKSSLERALRPQPLLVTLLFTLNELYTASITKTTAFLLSLTAAVPLGTMLLVVDSPGSYSEATLGKDAKKYPMQWLMDRTLLGDEDAREETDGKEWEKLVADDSRWFRMPRELKYPISLENIRYQIHLFQRLRGW